MGAIPTSVLGIKIFRRVRAEFLFAARATEVVRLPRMLVRGFRPRRVHRHSADGIFFDASTGFGVIFADPYLFALASSSTGFSLWVLHCRVQTPRLKPGTTSLTVRYLECRSIKFNNSSYIASARPGAVSRMASEAQWRR